MAQDGADDDPSFKTRKRHVACLEEMSQDSLKTTPRRVKDSPRWPQNGSRWSKMGPRRAKMGPTTGQVSRHPRGMLGNLKYWPRLPPRQPQERPKTGQDSPRLPQNGPRAPKNGPETSQGGTKIAQDGPDDEPSFKTPKRHGGCLEKMGQDSTETARRWPQDNPRQPQDGPETNQGGPKMAQEAC